ncbi:hypothetical protein [Allofournierella massiliensis]|uniref:hypothetical protein n=1 Tax=Allofournierella massiliensis TaxID=1650663 RepID=UPI0039A03303
MKQVIAALLIPWAKQEIKRKQPANHPSNMKSVPQSGTPYLFTIRYLFQKSRAGNAKSVKSEK